MVTLKHKLLLGLTLAGVNVAAITVPLVAAADSQQTTTQVGLTVNPVIISYSSGPIVTLGAVNPDTSGRQSTASDTINANTNDSAGLTVTLQENSAASTAMISGSNTIPASAGTTSSPVALANNTWGWRMDSLAGFGAGPTSTISNAAPSALTYAAIPANGSPFTLHTTSTNGSTADTVWYSARVNNTQAAGTYQTTVLYTVTTN